MRCDPHQLGKYLKAPAPRVYLVAGAEILLREEALSAIRQFLRAQGVEEREILEVDKNFDWQQLASAGATMSLFGSSRLLELRLNSGKIGREGGKAIIEWLGSDSADILLISSQQWDLGTEKTAWAKAVDKHGLYIPVWPIKPDRLPNWLGQRLRQRGLQPTADAIALLSARVEGNLLAAAQEVDKLALLRPPGPLSQKEVQAAVADSAQYDVFRLGECILNGATADALRICNGLLRAGEAPPLLIGLLAREFQLLVRWLHDAPKSGADAAFRQLGIWRSRQPPVQRAAKRLGPPLAGRALAALGQLDRLSKGQSRGDFQTQLERFIVAVSQQPPSDPLAAIQT